MDMGVGDLEAGDHQPHPGRGEQFLLGRGHPLGDTDEVTDRVGVEIDPVIRLGSGHHQHVTPVEGPDVEEGDTHVVAVNQPGLDLAVDYSGEDGRHSLIVG